MDCPVGRYSVEYAALSECTQCTAGKYNENTASTLASSCVDCDRGKYNTNVGSVAASDCVFCPTGKINPDTAGASSVSACSVNRAAGQGASSDSTSCESCTAGTYGPATGLGCFQCGRGKYSEAVGATAETQCVLCPEGKSSPLEGAPSHCETCTAGTYAPGEGYASCSFCNPGTSCAEGATEEVTCGIGYYSGVGSSECTQCGPTSIAISTGTAACAQCDLFQVANDERTECVCQQGYYVGEDANKALPVPNGVSPNTAGMTTETLDVLPGFWSTSNSSVEILPCLNSKHCMGGNKTTDFCANGYSGPLCAVCASGYAATGSGEILTCTECTGQAVTTVIAGLALVFLLLALLLLCVFKSTGEKTRETFQSQTRRTSRAMTNISGRIHKVAPVAKIVTAYFQVAGGLSMVYGLSFPKFYSTFSEILGGIFSMNFISFMPLGCTAPVDHYSSLMTYTIIPILLGIALIIGSRVAGKPELRNKIFEVFLGMTFLILPAVAMKIFSTFACSEFDGEYGSFLKVDYSIACDDSSERGAYTAYAGLMILVYPLGIPTMYFVLLFRKLKLIDPGQEEFEKTMSKEEALEKALKIREGECEERRRRRRGASREAYSYFRRFFRRRKRRERSVFKSTQLPLRRLRAQEVVD